MESSAKKNHPHISNMCMKNWDYRKTCLRYQFVLRARQKSPPHRPHSSNVQNHATISSLNLLLENEMSFGYGEPHIALPSLRLFLRSNQFFVSLLKSTPSFSTLSAWSTFLAGLTTEASWPCLRNKQNQFQSVTRKLHSPREFPKSYNSSSAKLKKAQRQRRQCATRKRGQTHRATPPTRSTQKCLHGTALPLVEQTSKTY